MESLADLIEPDDPPFAAAMRARIAEKLLLDAAELFRLSKLTNQAKLEALLKVFDTAVTADAYVKELLDLPFRAFVTTNYDDLIETTVAAMSKQHLLSYRNTSADLKAASYSKKRYVVHLHGATEVPELIVLSRSDYAPLDSMEEYSLYLRHLFRDFTVLFVGYSFRDPDISLFLEYLKKYLGLPGDGPALALVSASDQEIQTRLRDTGIKPIPVQIHGGHVQLWETLRRVAGEVRQRCGGKAVETATSEREQSLVLRSLAAVYAYYRAGRDQPVRDTVIGGITLSIISQMADRERSAPVEAVERRLAQVLFLNAPMAHEFLGDALQRLETTHTAVREDTRVRLLQYDEQPLRADFQFLIRRLRDRAHVRYNVAIPGDVNLESFLVQMLLGRGLGIAHSIVRQRPLETVDLDESLGQAFAAAIGQSFPEWRGALFAATKSLLSAPTGDEASTLASLARMVMMTDVVINAPTLKSFSGFAEVAKIYLDANVLMPALLPNHPRQAAYSQILANARERGTRIIASTAFVNEVASHRYGALQAYKLGGFENRETFTRYVQLFGSDGINAFLGAYAGWLASGGGASFATFLREFAPYDNELALTGFLREHGIEVVDFAFDRDIEVGRIARWEAALRDEYRAQDNPKPRTLIWHEARQIEALLVSMDQHSPAWFVTADRKLIRAVGAIVEQGHLLPPTLLQGLLTPLQVGAYLDLASDRNIDWAGYSSLFWTRAYREFNDAFAEYAVDRVLREYEAALTMSIPAILEACKAELAKKGAFESKPEDSGEEARLGQFRLLEQFEPRFYELMAEEKRKRGLG